MTVFFTLLMTATAFVFITYPFFKARLQPVEATEQDPAEELYARRDTTYSMLKELEFDYRSGILTEEDYKDLEARYKKKAISALKDIDNISQPSTEDNEIEN